MKLHFATVPARDPGDAAVELNTFLARHRVVGVEKHLVGETGAAFWAVCVTYTDSKPATSASQPKRGRIDYRDILNDHDFAVFAELRKLRKQFSERESIPPYAVFNNEQLATMVTKRTITIAAFKAIEGIGPARIDRYAAPFIARLKELLNDSHATSSEHSDT